MQQESYELSAARERVLQGEWLLVQQAWRVERYDEGPAKAQATRLLATMQKTLALMRRHLALVQDPKIQALWRWRN
jgi:hypothetical protein